jgi:hypothetical protein
MVGGMYAPRGALSGWARGLWRARYLLLYVALAASLPLALRHAYDARTGFTSLIWFGERFAGTRLQRLADVPLYTFTGWDGYDGQFYAQVAVAGNPLDPELGTALDSAGYRARRALLPIAAHVAGLGRPAWVIQIYALSNLLCWLLLAVLLARWWFPPTDFGNLLRWAGTLFGTGALVSVARSLTDVPALLVIAVGARCLERHRSRLAALLFAAAGFVRETSVLAVAALVPAAGTPRRGRRALRAAALVIAPTAVWVGVLALRYGQTAGARNFAPPFVEMLAKARAIAAACRDHGFSGGVRGEICAVIALLTQVGFMLARPRPRDAWWRLGTPFALLVLVLGEAVWEGEPSAATRAVLPLTLAFNVLVPRNLRGLALLVVGNLTLMSAPRIFDLPTSEQTVFARGVAVRYAAGWHAREQIDDHAWRWASGAVPAVIRVHNPTRDALPVTLELGMRSVVDRQVSIRAPGAEARVQVPPSYRAAVRVGPFTAPPGDTDLTFATSERPWIEPSADGRALTLSVEDLSVVVGAPVR